MSLHIETSSQNSRSATPELDVIRRVSSSKESLRRLFIDPFDFSWYITTLLVTSMVSTAVVASHSWAYLVNPQGAGISTLRSVELYVFWAAWILLCIGPVSAVIWSQYRNVWRWFIPSIATLWPATLLAIHATLKVEFGDWYFGYLNQHPWMYLTDVVVPLVLIGAQWRAQWLAKSLNLSYPRKR